MITISLGNRSTIIASHPRRQQGNDGTSDDEIATILTIYTTCLAIDMNSGI